MLAVPNCSHFWKSRLTSLTSKIRGLVTPLMAFALDWCAQSCLNVACSLLMQVIQLKCKSCPACITGIYRSIYLYINLLCVFNSLPILQWKCTKTLNMIQYTSTYRQNVHSNVALWLLLAHCPRDVIFWMVLLLTRKLLSPGLCLCAQLVARGMKSRGSGGSIVNVSSQASQCALKDHAVYCK